jgi:uncharacterized protein YggE
MIATKMQSGAPMLKLIVPLLGLFALALPARAQTIDTPLPSVTVTGEATLSVAPDRAIVRAGVTNEAKTAAEAMAANSRQMAAVLTALKAAGIAEVDIQTTRVNLDTVVSPGGGSHIVGFRASNQVTVQIRDIARASDILDRLVTAGANTLSGLDFIVSDQSKVLDKVRAEAIADARRKAQIYAQAANVTLGRPLWITEEGAPVRPMLRMTAGAAQAIPIAPGEEQLRISVTVSFELMR